MEGATLLLDPAYELYIQQEQNYPYYTAVLAAVLVYVFYYLFWVVQPPRVYCGQQKMMSFMKTHCPTVNRCLWTTPCFLDGAIHTTMAYCTRKMPEACYDRELFRLKDGGQVSLDWLITEGSRDDPAQPTLLVLPGLNGDSQACYVKPVVLHGRKMGYRVVVFNNRGKGGIQLVTPKTYNGIDYSDLREVILHIKDKFPHSPLIAAGTSLGGMILGHYIGNMGYDTKLEAAVLFSSVFDAEDAISSLEKWPINIHINRYLAKDMVGVVKAAQHLFRDHKGLNVDTILKSSTMREFDNSFTSLMSGFSTAEEFYSAATLRDKLKGVKIPTLAINAADDPFQPGSSLPTAEDIKDTPIAMVVTNKGGHLGFLEWGNVFYGANYAEEVFEEFCHAVLNKNSLPSETIVQKSKKIDSNNNQLSDDVRSPGDVIYCDSRQEKVEEIQEYVYVLN